jgi:hypothetical protein
MELSLLGFWSFIYHLLTVLNSCAIWFKTWKIKTAKQGPLMLLALLSSVNEIGWGEYKLCLAILGGKNFLGCMNIFRKKMCVYRVRAECPAKCSEYDISTLR